MDLSEAHVHHFDNACVKGCLNDGFDVLDVNGFALVEVVGGFVVVVNGASVNFVQRSGGLAEIYCEGSCG